MSAFHWRDRDAAIEDLGFDLKRLLHEMTFVTIAAEITNGEGELVMRQTDTLIQTGG